MIRKRILQFIEYKGDTKYKFYQKTGFANGFLDKEGNIGSDKCEKICYEYPDLSLEWLITGKGEMLKSDNLPTITPTNNPNEGIPLIPTEAMAGVSRGEISILELDCERYVIPMFKDADFLIPVKGSSMYPKYNSGDVVACKRVPMQDIFFQWNKVYVLDTNQGAIIKRVAKSEQEGSIKIISDNPSYEPFDLQLSQIYSIAIVVGVVRQE